MFDTSDDARWASRLEGIAKSATMAHPASTKSFATTKLLLEAGLQLKEEDFARGDGGASRGMSRITRKEVAKRSLQLAEQRSLDLGPRAKSLKGAFNVRWQEIDLYRRDLIIYELYSLRWREASEISRRLMVRLTEIGAERLADIVRATVARDANVRSRFMRYVISQANLAVDPAFKELARRAHAEFRAAHRADWITAYQILQRKSGVELRPMASLEELWKWISWMVQGAALEASVTDSDASELLAKGVMALILGTIDLGDHRSVEDVINHLVV